MANNLFMEKIGFDLNNAAVGTSLEDVGDPVVLAGQHPEVAFSVTAADNNLADFAVLVKFHPDDSWITMVSDTTWTNSELQRLVYKTADPSSLSAGSAAGVWIEVGLVHAVKFQAQAASGTSDVSVRGTFWRQ